MNIVNGFVCFGKYARSDPLMNLEQIRFFFNVLNYTERADISSYQALLSKVDDVWGISRIFQGLNGLCTLASTLHVGFSKGELTDLDRASIYRSSVKILKNGFLGASYLGKKFQMIAVKAVTISEVLGRGFSVVELILEDRSISVDEQAKRNSTKTATFVHDWFEMTFSLSSCFLDLVVIAGCFSGKYLFVSKVEGVLTGVLVISHLVSGVAQLVIDRSTVI
ncbi:MAG: hypothetical protein P0S95_04180 [Rhabdochlamydiaceae bacterium]|nr:hypothetical protein [Candidatus Amphrikana amoebophyrae]